MKVHWFDDAGQARGRGLGDVPSDPTETSADWLVMPLEVERVSLGIIQ